MSLSKVSNQSNWPAYDEGARVGMAGSATLVAVCMVAFAVLYGVNYPDGLFIAANYPLLGTLGAVAGGALVLFAISTVIRFIARAKSCPEPKVASLLTEPKMAAPSPEIISDVIISSSEENEPSVEAEVIILSANGEVIISSEDEPSVEEEASVEEGFALLLPEPEAVAVEKIDVAQLKELTPPLMNAAQRLFLAFFKTYYGEKKDLKVISEAVTKIRALIDEILNDKRELVRLSIFYAFDQIFDPEQLKDRWTLTPELFLKALPRMLIQSPSAGCVQGFDHMKTLVDQLSKNSHSDHSDFKSLLGTAENACKAYHASLAEEKKDLEKVAELEKIYQKARFALFRLFLQKIKVTDEEVENWSSHLIPEFLGYFKFRLFSQLLPEKLSLILKGHQPTGVFTKYWMLIYAATSWLARSKVFDFVREEQKKTPISQKYKDRIIEIIQLLLPELSNPLYDATCRTGSPIYEKTKRIFGEAITEAPQFKHEAATWAGYFASYTAYVHDLSLKFGTEVA